MCGSKLGPGAAGAVEQKAAEQAGCLFLPVQDVPLQVLWKKETLQSIRTHFPFRSVCGFAWWDTWRPIQGARASTLSPHSSLPLGPLLKLHMIDPWKSQSMLASRAGEAGKWSLYSRWSSSHRNCCNCLAPADRDATPPDSEYITDEYRKWCSCIC